MSYPTSIDSIPQPSSTSPTNNPGAAEVSTAQTNAIVAVETKVGTGASTPTSGTVLTGNGTGTSDWGATTGSGNVVLATSPTLVTPALGTPASGVATNLTGTASGLTAGNVTTNANLTGPITSSGNTTSIASQTGTGSKFVVDTSPTIVTPTIVKNANPVMSLNGNPVWQYLGSATSSTDVTAASGTASQITGLSSTVTVPSGYTKVRVTVILPQQYNSGSNVNQLSLYRGTVPSGTNVPATFSTSTAETSGNVLTGIWLDTPGAGSVTYNAGFSVSGGTGHTNGASQICTILVECC
jgi:hypothetical protein